MRISDWSSDVCSSDLKVAECDIAADRAPVGAEDDFAAHQIGLVGILKIAAERQPVGQAAAIEARKCDVVRSEERRVGKECVSTCRSRWSPDHSTKNKEQ